MLRWAIAFALISIVAGFLGFYGLSDVAADIAKFFMLVFLVLFIVAIVLGRRILSGPTV